MTEYIRLVSVLLDLISTTQIYISYVRRQIFISVADQPTIPGNRLAAPMPLTCDTYLMNLRNVSNFY